MIFPTKTWTGRRVKLSLSPECEKFLCKLFGKWSLVYLPRVVISFHCIFIKPSSQRPVKLQPRKPTSIPKNLENDGIHVKCPFNYSIYGGHLKVSMSKLRREGPNSGFKSSWGVFPRRKLPPGASRSISFFRSCWTSSSWSCASKASRECLRLLYGTGEQRSKPVLTLHEIMIDS